MTNRGAAVLLIGGIGLMAASIPRGHSRAPAHRVHKAERPWLTREAQDQLLGESGVPGPLFAGVTLGGPAPSQPQRDAIAAFAKANDLDIRLEVTDDTLVAIRASVTFGGCCGYEAVDLIGRRLSRPYTYPCCDCGEGNPVDDWAYEPEPGVHVRFHTHVNTLAVRWEPALTTEELLDASEALIGTPIDKVKRHAGDRIHEIEPHDFVLELPYDEQRPAYEGFRPIGTNVETHAGLVREVSFELLGPAAEGDEMTAVEKLLRARWGRPHVDAELGSLVWHRGGRVITANVSSYGGGASVTIAVPEQLALQ